MWHNTAEESANDVYEQIYRAGQQVQPGLYRQIGGSREVQIATSDHLPASLDGRVACWVRVQHTWAQVAANSVQM